MANKIIKYNLTAGGTIPTYIADGGYYPKANGGASPQDWDLIGATTDGSSETGLGELANEAAIESIGYSSIIKSANSGPNSQPDKLELDTSISHTLSLLLTCSLKIFISW